MYQQTQPRIVPDPAVRPAVTSDTWVVCYSQCVLLFNMHDFALCTVWVNRLLSQADQS